MGYEKWFDESKEEQRMICGMTYFQICLYFLIYSFGGWVVEVIFHAVSHKLMASVETQAKKQDIPIIRNKNNSKFAFEQSLDLVDECTGACRVCKNKECIMKHQ